MKKYNRKEQLKLVHENRKAMTQKKVDEAIQRLVRAKQVVNFNSVANEAGVSKATLYNTMKLRKQIETLRQQQLKRPALKQLKHEMNENNKDAIIESLKRKIKRIDQENKDLREQLKIAYAQVYKNI
ncbi:DUF6262 family protein [Priestia megaterium]|uniref:DUF6262 family protein n=1 Tax=Priestia megaterium TaxID=1404 RepID=UPI001A94E739|nr:DUF6262 family protein [Priestia megaterium]QSX23895.1 transposase [Priestia megaterium]